MVMHWPEATRELYEQLRAEVDWAGMRPLGANLHMSAFDDAGGLHVVDHWDSAEQFQTFIQEKIAPAAQAAGVTTQPQVAIFPVAYIDQFDRLEV
jgi:hypothetical protein